MPDPSDDPITRAFIGHAMTVHSEIGPGLDEQIYHQELTARLTTAGIEHLYKPKHELSYRGIVADIFEPDMVVARHFIPELKCLRGSFGNEHLVQLFCYCKFWRLRIGMLIDFGKDSLFFKRFAYTSKTAVLAPMEIPDFVTQPALAARILDLAREVLTEVGLGYRETTWRGLMAAALMSGGLSIVREPTALVLTRKPVLLPSLMVEGECAVMVTALNEGISATDRAVMQTHLRWLGLKWGVILHFGKATVDARFVSAPKGRLPTDSERPID